MANPAELLLFTIIDLLRGALVLSIPVFLLVFAGKWLREKIAEKTKWSWLISALASTYCLMWALLLLLYFFPYIAALGESNVGEVPSIFATTAGSLIESYVFGLVKVTISALVVSLLLMPFELIGAFIYEWVNKKLPTQKPPVNLFITSYLVSLVSAAIVLFIIPEAVTGLLFYIYFG